MLITPDLSPAGLNPNQGPSPLSLSLPASFSHSTRLLLFAYRSSNSFLTVPRYFLGGLYTLIEASPCSPIENDVWSHHLVSPAGGSGEGELQSILELTLRGFGLLLLIVTDSFRLGPIGSGVRNSPLPRLLQEACVRVRVRTCHALACHATHVPRTCPEAGGRPCWSKWTGWPGRESLRSPSPSGTSDVLASDMSSLFM